LEIIDVHHKTHQLGKWFDEWTYVVAVTSKATTKLTGLALEARPGKYHPEVCLNVAVNAWFYQKQSVQSKRSDFVIRRRF